MTNITIPPACPCEDEPLTAAPVKRPSIAQNHPVGGVDKRTGRKKTAGQPVFLRVKTLFETSFRNGAVVAVHPDSNSRIVWDAPTRRMNVQTFADGRWTDAGSFTRGALMRARRDEQGWRTPDNTQLAATDTAPANTPAIHTGAMIALIPSDDDLDRLRGDEARSELHLTLAFLGEAVGIDEDTRSRIVDAATGYFNAPVQTEATNVIILNPHTDEHDTAIAMGVRGMDLVGPRENIMSAVRGVFPFEETFKPWLPHVTMAYTDDHTRVAEFIPQLGPITFDKIRFAFGGEITDIPLGVTEMTDDNGDPLTAAVSRLDPDLRKYWLGPKGSARVGGWGNEGSFTACQREMRKEGVSPRMIDGLCANLYEAATGHSPGRKKEESALTASVLPGEDAATYAEWDGVITVEGVESGDGRMFNLGSLDWAQLPQPLMYQPANTGGHSGSVLVGQITGIARDDNRIRAWGIIDLEAQHNGENIGREVHRLMDKHYHNGVSVDVDKVSNADVETFMSPAGGTRTVFSRGRIRGATLVAFPAFVEAQLNLTGETLTASAVQERYGTLAEALPLPVPEDTTPLTAAAHTITIPDLPPAAWFDRPTDVELKGALTVTDEGRVYGLLAPRDTTHRGVNTKVPTRNVDYSRFHKGETIVEGGGRVVTGVITMNCGHAPGTNYGTLENRIEHYDNSCAVAANVRIGEHNGEVWVAGATAPFATAEQVTKMLGCTLSGDWQPHPDRPGVREFVAALLVPVPGFALARREASVRYEEGALVASAVPVEFVTVEHDTAPLLARKEEMIRAHFTARKMELVEGMGNV